MMDDFFKAFLGAMGVAFGMILLFCLPIVMYAIIY